jgi:radical SAM superfamily enzyme YgiQ (UPF0313 family)
MIQENTRDTNPTVVLVRLANPNFNILTPPIGIGYLLKSLSGIEKLRTVFIDCKLEQFDDALLIKRLEEYAPLLVGFQVFSVDYGRFAAILPQVKQRLPNTFTIAGGPHISGLPSHTLKVNPSLDFAVAGEGEVALPMIVRNLLSSGAEPPVSSIPNLVHRTCAVIVENENALSMFTITDGRRGSWCNPIGIRRFSTAPFIKANGLFRFSLHAGALTHARSARDIWSPDEKSGFVNPRMWSTKSSGCRKHMDSRNS